MGIQGPLTAQSLGRSPYDDVVAGEGVADTRQPELTYDHRGRPVNPTSKTINRDLIRSHNEVMVVIGVAEPDVPKQTSETESQRRHDLYEETVGIRIDSVARHCMELVGIVGIAGLRQRILIYRRYSEIPFAHLLHNARREMSFTQEVLPGVPLAVATNWLDRAVVRMWLEDRKAPMKYSRKLLHEAWAYIRVHLKLFSSLQRVGLMPGRWYPSPKFFIPFTSESPIPPPPPFPGLKPAALLQWTCVVVISTIPFFSWVTMSRIARDLKPELWREVFRLIPNTAFRAQRLPPLPLPPTPSSPIPGTIEMDEIPQPVDNAADDWYVDEPAAAIEPVRRAPSVHSTRGDGYETEDDGNDEVGPTFISFEVEATESTDAPPGHWSAELQPSHPFDGRLVEERAPVYFDTILTQLPATFATNIFTNALIRICMAPYESFSLRMLARMLRYRRGMPMDDIYELDMLDGFNTTSVVNFLAAELLHLVISGELWAVFAGLTQFFHRSEEEWKEDELEQQRLEQQEEEEQQRETVVSL